MTQPWSNTSQFALIIINANTGTISGLFVFDASGNLIDSIAAAAGTINGQAYKASIATYRPSDGLTVNLDTGKILFSFSATTAPGFISDAGSGSMQIVTALATGINPGDITGSMILQSKANSNDGTHPELVIQQRIQIQDESGNPSWICQVDPNSPNADEVFHNMSFVNSWTGGGRTTPGFRLQPDKAAMLLGGSFTVPAGVVAGQAMTSAFPAQYRPNNIQSLSAWNLTGANANNPIRLFLSAGGVLTFGGPIASVAGGDILDMPFQYVALTR